MNDSQDLIPPPPVVRGRLARNIRERRLLQSLLRLSVRAAQEGDDERRPEARREAEGRGVDR